jgi:hypothetical protein
MTQSNHNTGYTWFTPSMGLCSPTLRLFIIFFQCTEPQNQLRIGQEIFAHLARSSFPELGTEQSLLTITCTYLCKFSTHGMHKSFTTICTQLTGLQLLINRLLASPRYLFILYKRGLNMGKTHGPTSHTCYIIPKPKNPTKGGDIPRSSLSLELCLRPTCRSPKNGQKRPKFSKIWSRANNLVRD